LKKQYRRLNPKPSEADTFQIIKTAMDSFYMLHVPTGASGDEKKEKSSKEPVNVDLNSLETDENLLHGNALYESTAKGLDDLLNAILDRDLSNDGLVTIFKQLEPWITSVNDQERLRSIRSLSSMLKHFAANFKLNASEVDIANTFININSLFI
jgi:hypothetical protein